MNSSYKSVHFSSSTICAIILDRIINEMWRIFGDTQRGFINKGIVGGAQIDRYGNPNTTLIYCSGGANDIASSCDEIITMMKLDKGQL